MTTLSLVTCCYGMEYAEFIFRWWSGVLKLNRKPDEIILGIAEGDPTGLSKSIPEGVEAKVVVLPEGSNMEKWDYATRQATSKWWLYMPIDDELLPEALDELEAADETGAEIICDSIVVRHNQALERGHWDTSSIATRLPIPGWPMTTLEIYKRLTTNDYKFGDWAFQIDAAAEGAKVYFANTRRMIWDAGIDRNTLSSNHQPDKQYHLDQIYKYAKSKGF
jgi:hypothetical protein